MVNITTGPLRLQEASMSKCIPSDLGSVDTAQDSLGYKEDTDIAFLLQTLAQCFPDGLHHASPKRLPSPMRSWMCVYGLLLSQCHS